MARVERAAPDFAALNPGYARHKERLTTQIMTPLFKRLYLLSLLALTAAPAAHADDFAFGRRLFLDKAQCLYCHGWAGDGAGEPQSNGAAANLPISPLKRDQLIEVITCG